MASHSLGLMKGKERNIKAVWQRHWTRHKGFMTEGKLLNHETFAGMIVSPSLCSGRVLNSSDTLSNSRVTATLAERNRAYVTLGHYWYCIYLLCASRFSWGASVQMGICLSLCLLIFYGYFRDHLCLIRIMYMMELWCDWYSLSLAQITSQNTAPFFLILFCQKVAPSSTARACQK